METTRSTYNARRAPGWAAWFAGLALVASVALAQAPATPTGSVPAAAPPATTTPAPAQPSSTTPAAPKTGAPSKDQGASKTKAASKTQAGKKSAAGTSAKSAGPPTRYLPNRFAGRAGAYYKAVWGIDSLSVKWAESGELIRFSWRVLDPEKARVLSDKKVEPSLIDPQAGVSLVIPTMEKVGQLRQSQTPEQGRSYWMVFSNRGRIVKRGHRVNVVVGPFRADNLVVD